MLSDEFAVVEVRPLDRTFSLDRFKELTAKNRYYAYTKAFDEVVSAEVLATNDEIGQLHRYLEHNSKAIAEAHSGLAMEISDVLAASRTPPSLSVCLLLDNSGSLRGGPITCVAATALVISRWLEKWGIRFEVLGFTTRAWIGGRSRERWLADGKPPNPGRLNELRHIIYKSFDETLSCASPNFGVMLKNGIIKENIDGEALIWASSRLRKQDCKKKFLLVMTDGAPVDDSTLSVNRGNFLQNHLIDTIRVLEASDLQLMAIGVGYSPEAYTHGVQVLDDNRLGLPFLETLKLTLSGQG